MNIDLSYLPRPQRRSVKRALAAIHAQCDQWRDVDVTALLAAADRLRADTDRTIGTDPDDHVTAFALAAIAAGRALGYTHHDVQLLAGFVLAAGDVAEVRTGEGKTLIATLPAVSYALGGHQVHVMTANEYLARRDAAWMAPVYAALGVTVAHVDGDQSLADRKAAYEADVVYGTAAQFGFDYLADHLVIDPADVCQAQRTVAIVDEADALLLDDARTPLIISGEPAKPVDLAQVDEFARTLSPYGYDIYPENRVVALTESGAEQAEVFFEVESVTMVPRLYAAIDASLRAHYCYRKDREYLVVDGEVVIVDESTGRPQPGRRWQHGLHEALEVKEQVAVRQPLATVAQITIPSLLALYDRVAAMTGTASTDAGEFASTYQMATVSVPTNQPVRRIDADDVLFVNRTAKFAALTAHIAQCRSNGQPVLIGAPTVADAERVSEALQAVSVPHELISAKHLGREASVVALAGLPGAVTVATNMAGRGVDIVLGGNVDAFIDRCQTDRAFALEHQIDVDTDDVSLRTQCAARCMLYAQQVRDAGGLCVLATARHSARRIDEQLRGRSGRQGDPGYSQFYLSLDDELLTMFAADSARSVVRRAAGPDGSITHPTVTKLIASAQEKVERTGRESREALNRFQRVIDAQQRQIYSWRESLVSDDPVAAMTSIIAGAYRRVLDGRLPLRGAIDPTMRLGQALRVAFDADQDTNEDTDEYSDAVRHIDDPYQSDLGHGFHEPGSVDWNLIVSFAASPADFVDSALADRCDAVYISRRRDDIDELADQLAAECVAAFQRRHAEDMLAPLQVTILRLLDNEWQAHLQDLEALTAAANLRQVGKLDPLVEFTREATELFDDLVSTLLAQVARLVALANITRNPAPAAV